MNALDRTERGICRMQKGNGTIPINGFTLIEVLLALSLVSVILAALYSSFFLSKKAIDAADGPLLRLQESRALLDIMKREIEAAFYDKTRSYTAFKLEDQDFDGREASRLTFTTFTPGFPGLAKVEYRAVESDGRISLVKKVISAYARSADAKDIELIEDIESFTVEIRYADKWVKTWDNSQAGGIPGELKISIRLRNLRNTEQKDLLESESSRDITTIYDVAKPMTGRTL
jgi:general secretion pathway protein J